MSDATDDVSGYASRDASGDAPVEIQKIWDVPTRLLKWSMAGVFAATWWYGWTLSFTTLSTHRLLAYALAAILALRVIWGFIGAPASRFSAILRAIADAPAYTLGVLRRAPSHYPGHNPMGSLWMVGFFALLLVQIGTGLMTYSDSFFDGGPLASTVGSSWSAWANGVHALVARLLLAMVALHLTAVAFYAVWKGENLVRPMLTGWKPVRRKGA